MRNIPALLPLIAAAVLAGCGSSSGSRSTLSGGAGTTTAATSASGGVDPNARETLPPGDIPDAIAYVPYAMPGEGLSVSTPEGWSRSNAAGTVTFSDKLNEVRVFSTPARGSLTAASVRSNEVPRIAASVKRFKLQSVTTVSRPAGPAVRVAYLGDSAPDPVTRKVGVLAFERYDFVHRGREVILVLSSPNGSDNVDPWKKVTSSLRFTR